MDFSSVNHLPLLPDDRKFIDKLIGKESEEIIFMALEDYEVIWIEAAAQEPVEHKKANVGRRAANTFLRTVVKPSL